MFCDSELFTLQWFYFLTVFILYDVNTRFFITFIYYLEGMTLDKTLHCKSGVSNTSLTPFSLRNKHDVTSPCRPRACLTLSAPHAIFNRLSKKNRFWFEQVKYNTIYAFWENIKSGIQSRKVPVWRGLINIVLSVINPGPNN